MAKGMNLEQFKDQLDTDAQKRCIAQEKTIKELLYRCEQYKSLLKDRDKTIEQLQNRCFAQTKGLICLFCGFASDCKARRRFHEK